jgi:hypothetical protein
MAGPRVTRRELLRLAGAGGGALGLAAVLAACGGDEPGGTSSGAAPAGSLKQLAADATQVSLLGAQSQLPVGKSLFTFGLATADNRLVTGGSPQVWVARDDTSKAAGPFPSRWFELTAYAKTRDNSPRSQLTGFYGAEVELPEAGNWMVAAAIDAGGRQVGQGAVPVSAEVPSAVGTRAKPLKTPVATSAAGRKKICTRDPACPLHAISLDKALAAGKPTVLDFGTPLLCSSQMCGPVVDEQMVAAAKLGGKASFIHVEIYPSRDTAKPVKALTDYGFTTEPWILVIDRDGVIRNRFEGPVTAGQIEDALRPLLA